MEDKKLLEERYSYVENRRNVGEWFRKRMSWLILIVASILFVFKEGLEFSASQDDVITLVMSMAFTYLFALYVAISMRSMGKKSGKESNMFMGALKYLAEAKQSIKNIMYLLPRFIRHKNETSLEDVKKLFIEENGLLYALYQKGYYDKKEIFENLDDFQKKALKEIDKIKITKLQPSDLLSEHSKSKSRYYDPLYLGKDERTDAQQSGFSMALSKAILPIITSYFAIQVVLGSSLLWGAIQVAVIMLMGVTHYMEGEDYILNELRNRQINKADLLIEFKNLYDNAHNIFKEEEEILKKIDEPEPIQEEELKHQNPLANDLKLQILKEA
jgi:Spy/CpxP family protein refolding chaperone